MAGWLVTAGLASLWPFVDISFVMRKKATSIFVEKFLRKTFALNRCKISASQSTAKILDIALAHYVTFVAAYRLHLWDSADLMRSIGKFISTYECSPNK